MEDDAGQGTPDLYDLRDKYLAILEHRVVVPARRDLTARAAELQQESDALDGGADADIARRSIDIELDRVRIGLGILERGPGALRSLGLADLRALAGLPVPPSG